MVELYTEQVEKYESQNTTFSLGSIAFLGVLLGIIIGLVNISKGEPQQLQSLKYRIISLFSLSIPIATTFVLFTLSLNMQKVALFRGYLYYLNSALNALLGTNDMMFDNNIIGDYMGPRFWTNSFGPFALGAFVIFIFAISIYTSLYFYRLAPTKRFAHLYRSVMIPTVIICTLCCFIFMRDLILNGDVRWEVGQLCSDLNGIN